MPTPLRVLIVEDRESDAELMVAELCHAGFEPDWHRVDREADYLALLDPCLDIILADYGLPQWDALQALRLMQDRGLDIPFIVVTGILGDELAAECVKRGASDFVLKDRMARLPLAVHNALEQRRLREERIQAETALSESEGKLRALLTAVPDAVIVIDADGQIVLINGQAEELFGYSQDELLGNPIENLMPERFQQPHMQHRSDYIVEPRRRQMDTGLPIIGRGKSGREFPLEITLGPVSTAEGNLFISVIKDVTERKKTEEDLLRRTQELETLFQIAGILAEPQSFESKATRVLDQLTHMSQADWVTLRLADENQQVLNLVAAAGQTPVETSQFLSLSEAQSLSRNAIRQGESIVVNDYPSHPDANPAMIALGVNSVVLVPVKTQDRTVGLMNIVSKQLNHFTPERVRLVTAIADDIGPMLENVRLSEQVRAHSQEMAIVDQVARIVTSTLDIDQVYDQFAAELKKLVGFERMALKVIDEDDGTAVLKYVSGINPSRSSVGIARRLEDVRLRDVVATGKTLVIGDLGAGQPFPLDQQYLEAGLNSLIIVPLVSRGTVIAALTLRSSRVSAFGIREQAILERLANQVAPAIENTQLYELTRNAEKAAQARSQEQSVLFDVASVLSKPGDFLDKATSVMEQLAQVSEVEWATLRLPDQDGNLVLLVAAGSAIHTSPPMPVLSDRETLAYSAFRESDPIVANDYPAEPMASPAIIELGMKSMVLFPLKSGGRTLGLINLVSRQTNHFTPELVKLLTAVTDGVGALLENSRLSQELQASGEEMAMVDDVARIITSTLDIEQAYDQFAAEVLTLLPSDQISINVIDHDASTYVTKYESGLILPERELGKVYPLVRPSETSIIATTFETLIREDIAADPRYAVDRDLVSAGIRSSIRVAMVSKNQAIGTLALRCKRIRAYGNRERRILERLANQIAPAIVNSTLYQQVNAELEQRHKAEDALTEINLSLEEALAELRQTQSQVVIQERMNAMGQMASGIAHDFNNALAPIVAFTELLLLTPDALDDKERVTQYLGHIFTAAQDAANSVKQLREFYREVDDTELLQGANLNNAVERVISLTQAKWLDQAQANGITINIQTDLQEIPLVDAGAPDLRQVLTNLIFNAVDAMQSNGTITFRTRSDGEQVVLEVSDTGIGMPEEVQHRCMEPFYSTKGDQGTGLGLSMVYGIIQRHRGAIEIESETNKGTTFTIRLPVYSGTQVSDEPTPEKGVAQRTPLHVLVVDDDPAGRLLLADYLHVDGHTVDTASDGAEALERFHSARYDLVLTDRAMPGMNGDQLVAGITEVAPDQPIIMLTGFGDIMADTLGTPSGVDLVMTKPVTLTQLRGAIEEVILGSVGRGPKRVDADLPPT